MLAVAPVGARPDAQSLPFAGRDVALTPKLWRDMRDVNDVHSQVFNRRHGQRGHVLQGRFKAVLVGRDS